MIYEETYNYLLKNVSSKEFDVCLYSLVKMDWDGYVRSNVSELASKVGTTRKYIREMFRKFTSKAKGRNVLTPVETAEGVLYRLNIAKSSLQYNTLTDKYCKKYEFFYTDAFRKLPISAKRLLLMGAFRMSVKKSEEVVIGVSEIVPSTQSDMSIPFTKKRLVEAIRAIQESEMKGLVQISLSSNIYTQKEVVIFTFKEGTLEEFVNNHTERMLIRKKLIENGYYRVLPDEYCIELEKVAKHLYTSLLEMEKNEAKKGSAIPGSKDELLKLSRYVLDSALAKLATALQANKDLNEPKKVSAYFSAIVNNLMMEESAKYTHQMESIESLLGMSSIHSQASKMMHGKEVSFVGFVNDLDPIYQKKRFIHRICTVLQYWSENWVIARIKGVTEDLAIPSSDVPQEGSNKKRWRTVEDALARVEALKGNTYERIEQLKDAIRKYGNKAVLNESAYKFLEKTKESVAAYFAIQKERIEKIQIG